MKKALYLIISFSMVFVFFTFNTLKTEASDLNNQLVSVDTSIVTEYKLSISVNPNDPDLENTIYTIGEQQYKVEDLKLVEISNPSLTLTFNNNVASITPLSTDSQNVTLSNGQTIEKQKYVYNGTTAYTGSTGPSELRRLQITTLGRTVLNEITSDAPSIGCQKTISGTGYYLFRITNFSAATQTWKWEITF